MEALTMKYGNSIKTTMVNSLRGTVWPSSQAEMGPETNSTKQQNDR